MASRSSLNTSSRSLSTLVPSQSMMSAVSNDSSPPPTLKSRFQGLFKSKRRNYDGLSLENGSEGSRRSALDQNIALSSNGECIKELDRKEKYGLFEWTPPCSSEDDVIDIIAVHGLNGDAYDTWREGNQIWLKHFLPKQIPSIRVMSYGYNSNVFSRSAADSEDFALELLSRIRGVRRTPQEKSRPILFICHSLGGIVVKQALISAHERRDLHSNILEHTKGIVFMGTPHVGTNAADWPSIFVDLLHVTTFGATANATLLDGLRQNSQFLTKVCRQFTGRISGLKILTFYETLKCKGLNHLIVTRDSALLNHDHERASPIDADHRSMCRFQNMDSQNYKLVSSSIKSLVDDIKTPANGPEVVSSDRERSLFPRILATLFYASTSTTAEFNNSHRVEGTCTWILKHSKFLHWQSEVHSSNLLWITGGPGYGKTILSSFLSEELKKSPSCSFVCSFFCYDKINTKKVLCNIIYQLLSAKQELARHVVEHWDKKGEHFVQHWPTLCDIWKSCCNDPSSGKMILVIDALDECDESSRADLLGFLKPLLQQLRMSTDQNKLKVLIASRPEVDLIRELMHMPVSTLNLENESENLLLDIKQVIRTGVRDLVRDSQIRTDQADVLKDKLWNNAHGTFLWVGMIFKLLRDSLETRASEGLVDNLPEGLSEIYDQLLDRIPSNRQERAKVTLQLIIAAQRPLTLSEVDLLLAIQPCHSSEEEVTNLAEPFPYGMIKGLCGSFIRIVKENKSGIQYVYLVHQTAKEYLLRSRRLESGRISALWYSFTIMDCHLALAVRCIWFLLCKELDTKSLPEWSVNDQKDFESYVQDYTRNRVLLDYAGAHWATHLRQSESIADSVTINKSLRLYVQGNRYSTWSQVYWASQHSPARNYPPLHMCSHNGHARLLETLLMQRPAINKNEKDDEGETPLHRAAEAGHAKAIEVLLQSGVDVTIRNKAWRTALHEAAKANKESAVQSLVKGGANLDARLKDESTALHAAAADGLENMVQLLVKLGADVNVVNDAHLTASDLAFNKGYGSIQHLLLKMQTDSGITPLDQAIISGAEDEVIQLLEKGADFREKDTRGLTPLHRAAKKGNVNIVNLLISRGAPKELSDYDGVTALHVAAKYGKTEVVKRLIESNCNVNATNIDESRPLHQEVISGSKDAALQLIEAGADINHVDDEGKTALYHAANLGYLELLQDLISLGADCYIKARKDRTPLHAAAEKGHDKIVRYFLQSNSFEVDSKDLEGETALTLASRGESTTHAEVVRVLLDRGADPHMKQLGQCTPIFLAAECGNNTSIHYLLTRSRSNLDEEDYDGLTPLVIAAKKGHEKVLLLLLERGAKSVNNIYSDQTPLSWAAERGLEKAVKRLLKFEDVETNCKNRDGRTPISLAAGNGHLTVVGCLVNDDRIDVNHADNTGRTPLSWAAQEGHENVTRLLLDSGNSPTDREDEFGRAPISWAALNGHESIVQLLFERDSDASSSSIDAKGSSLLCLAASEGHESMVEFLLNHDERWLNRNNVYDETPLYFAAQNGHQDVVRILLSKSAINVNFQTRSGFTPLAIAAKHGHQVVIEQLLKHDHIIVDANTNDMNTPLSLAASNGNECIMRILMERGADPTVLNNKKESPLHLAAAGGYLAVVNLLVQAIDDITAKILARDIIGRTPLWVASEIGSEYVVKVFLGCLSPIKHGESRHEDNDGRTPLCIAAANGRSGTVRSLLTIPSFCANSKDNAGHTPLSISVKNGHSDVVAILLEHRPQVNVIDIEYGRTPLLWACSLGRTDLIELLLQNSDVQKDVRDKENASPIQLASASGSESAVQLLLDSGLGDLNASENQFGRSPLCTAAYNGHVGVARLLLSQDAIEPNMRANYGQTAFILAVIAGHEPIVRLLLESPMVNITLRDNADKSPILWASIAGHVNILRLLISKNNGQEDLNYKSNNGASPLYSAAEQGSIPAVQLLLSNGANPDIRDSKYRSTPLIVAAFNGFYEITKILLEEDGVEIDATDIWGQTALELAAINGNAHVVQLLLDKGASPNRRDKHFKSTPLMKAARKGHENVVRVLLAHKNVEPDCENDDGRTALWFACIYQESKNERWNIFNMLMNHKVRPDSNDSLGYTPLMAAATYQDNEMARVLLENGANPGLKDGIEHITAIACAAKSGCESIVRKLIDMEDPRVDPNAATLDNCTPLTYAAQLGHEGIVKLLLDLKPGVSFEHRTESDGRTPLMHAAANGHEAIVRLLLKHDVDVNACDKMGETPLILAIKSRSKGTVNELLKNGAKLDILDKDGTTPLIWAAFFGEITIMRQFLADIDVRARDRQGRTALSYAARHGDHETIRILISDGQLKSLDVNTKDKQDYTPATLAIRYGHITTLTILHENGADLDIRDRNGRSLLSHAAETGYLEAVRFLLSLNCPDVDLQDQAGRTAFSWAAEKGHAAVIRLLLENGADMEILDKKMKSPRSYAVDNDKKALVQLLDSHSTAAIQKGALTSVSEKGKEVAMEKGSSSKENL